MCRDLPCIMSIAAPTIESSPHAALISRLGAPNPEPALEHAMAQLARGGNVRLLLALAAAMTRCNLAGIALRLLRATAPHIQREPSVQAVVSQLAQLPSGAIPQAMILRQYCANRLALLERLPHLQEIGIDDTPPAGIYCFRSRAGNVHAIREGPNQSFSFMFAFVDQVDAVAKMALPDPDLATSVGFVGVPCEPLLRQVCRWNVQGYTPPITVIEPSLEALRAWLCMVEDISLLRDARLAFFAGDRAMAEYAAWLVAHPCSQPPSMVLTNHRAGWVPPRLDEAWRVDVDSRRRAAQAASIAIAEGRTRHRHRRDWQRRFNEAARSGSPLRVVGFTNRYSTVIQHAMRDLASAFMRAGHQFTIAAQPDACSAGVDVAGTLAETEFDLVVAINHLRFEYREAIPASIPYVGWIQDHMDHLWSAHAGRSVGEHDLIVAHAPDVLAGLYGYPRERMLTSSNLTDPVVYAAERLPDDELCPHRCELSFVSHGAQTPEALVESLARATSPSIGGMLREFLALVRDRLSSGDCLNAQQLLEAMVACERSSGVAMLTPAVRRATLYPQIAKIHDRVFRHQTLEWAVDWARSRGHRLRIYGRGWEAHPSLSAFAAGEVQSGRPLRAVYQASTINLQANAYSSLHQRLLDGVASGAMMISRYNPADFVRGQFLRIQQVIRSQEMSSINDVVAFRRSDQSFEAACHEAERLSGVVIAGLSDPGRNEQVRILREANDIAELQSDEGLFAMLRDLRYLPARVACDITGFAQTTFRTRDQMHVLLDRLLADDGLRQSLIAPMRNSVLQCDTFDVLAGRVIQTFADGAVTCAG